MDPGYRPLAPEAANPPGTGPTRAALFAALLAAGLGGATAGVAEDGPPTNSLAPNPLLERLGRNESRVYSAPFSPEAGGTVADYRLAERLERLGYRRVRERPSHPGEYFWGHEVFWIFRRAHDLGWREFPPLLFALDLQPPSGEIVGARNARSEPLALDRAWIEPELIAESLGEDRAVRVPIRLADLPERLWRAVLAAEDARFFEHPGLDGRALARATLANVKARRAVQGGSTLTQQLIKNRDLSPRRTLGRKASEAVRALALEAAYDKRHILEAYLDDVYLGHVDGLAIHGVGTAARVYFSNTVGRLSLAQAATLAAMIQGPNRLDPEDHPQRLRGRRDWVLGRMEELGWAEAEEVARAREQPVRVKRSPPKRPAARHFRAWLEEIARREAPRHLRKGRGVVAESTLDPMLQTWAEEETARWAARMRRNHRSLRTAPLGLALVSLDAESGDVLAYVGGDPADPTDFDRARRARRQPGSALKPLVLLEAFEDCGHHQPVHAATRLADEPLELTLPSGSWAPVNSDSRFRGVVTLRQALRESLNVPFVRLGRHCGFRETARRLRKAGLDLPGDPPPAFLLGAVETTPLTLAGAFAPLAAGGRAVVPRPARRLEKPAGRGMERFPVRRRRVADAATAFLVHDLLVDAVENGTGRPAAIEGLTVAAKTGTSSERRDAWMVGAANGLVTVVWVGRDDGEPLGLTGSQAAAPLWRAFVARASAARPPRRVERPYGVVTRFVDPESGLLVRSWRPGAEPELFRRDTQPRRNRFWRDDEDEAVIH
ncbi:MAG: transglycosylase domain-containing protein [Holophagales bacterium]|nr:transglycosylase domain-containing protein [Holophagales bacterium]